MRIPPTDESLPEGFSARCIGSMSGLPDEIRNIYFRHSHILILL